VVATPTELKHALGVQSSNTGVTVRARLIPLALCALALAVALVAKPTPAHAATNTSELRHELRALVAAGAPGAIVEVRDGSRTVRLAAGLARRSTHRPMRTNDRFRVGSVTKTFVATVVLQLVGEGKLALDDTVERWLPGLVPRGDKITVRQLLNHTSGLFDFLNEDPHGTVIKRWYADPSGHGWGPRDLVRLAARHSAHFAPGRRFSYSNTGYVVLGLIVEAATGHPLADELATRLFRPLQLRGTSFDTTPRIAGRHAHGYIRIGKRAYDLTETNPSYAWAAGAIVSTSDDLARFYRALLGGTILSPPLLQTMKETAVPADAIGGGSYGLGLWRLPTPPTFRRGCADPIWGHTGSVPGYVTYVYNSVDGRRQLVVSVNDDVPSARAERAIDQLTATAFCG
jgi:D-alanyl-D-alanine carboxypeptidase